jgi:hypothetical protein
MRRHLVQTLVQDLATSLWHSTKSLHIGAKVEFEAQTVDVA